MVDGWSLQVCPQYVIVYIVDIVDNGQESVRTIDTDVTINKNEEIPPTWVCPTVSESCWDFTIQLNPNCCNPQLTKVHPKIGMFIQHSKQLALAGTEPPQASLPTGGVMQLLQREAEGIRRVSSCEQSCYLKQVTPCAKVQLSKVCLFIPRGMVTYGDTCALQDGSSNEPRPMERKSEIPQLLGFGVS